ncbi:hypothetical protein D3C78_972100 [compost metagenome]
MIQRTAEGGTAQVGHRDGLLQAKLADQLVQPELALVAPGIEVSPQDDRALMTMDQRGQIVELLAEGGHPQLEVDRMQVDHQHAVRIPLQGVEAHQTGLGDAQQRLGGAHATDEGLRRLGHRHDTEGDTALGERLQLLPLEVAGTQPLQHLGPGRRLLQQHQILGLGILVQPLTPVLALTLVEIPDGDAELAGQGGGSQRHQRRLLTIDAGHYARRRDQVILIRHLETANQSQRQQGSPQNPITIFHWLTITCLCKAP